MKIIAVLLLASMGWAQSGSTSSGNNNPADREGAIAHDSSPQPPPAATAPRVSTYQRYSTLRRGREQEIMVVVDLAPEASPYRPYWNRAQDVSFVAVRFNVNVPPGFTVRYLRAAKDAKLSHETRLNASDKEVILLKLRAANDVPLGTQLLEGRLTYRRIDDDAPGSWASDSAVKQMDVQVPVEIVEHDAHVSEVDYWPGSKRGHNVMQRATGLLHEISAVTAVWALCQVGGCQIGDWQRYYY